MSWILTDSSHEDKHIFAPCPILILLAFYVSTFDYYSIYLFDFSSENTAFCWRSSLKNLIKDFFINSKTTVSLYKWLKIKFRLVYYIGLARTRPTMCRECTNVVVAIL